jgi:hypothetical protein
MNQSTSLCTRFLCAATTLVLVVLICTPAGADEDRPPAKSLRQNNAPTLQAARKRAAHRKRRMIMNNDGNDTRWPVEGEPRTRETFLDKRSTPLIGSHVDAIFYCTGCTFNLYRHHSQESELLTSAGDQEDWGWKLGEDGPDVLETMIDVVPFDCHRDIHALTQTNGVARRRQSAGAM